MTNEELEATITQLQQQVELMTQALIAMLEGRRTAIRRSVSVCVESMAARQAQARSPVVPPKVQ
jgi:hypothetical protein